MKALDEYMEVNPNDIVLLFHPDFDIYGRTKHMLQTLHNPVSKGVVVAADELNLKDFRGVTLALMALIDLSTVELQRAPHCSRIT